MVEPYPAKSNFDHAYHPSQRMGFEFTPANLKPASEEQISFLAVSFLV
jgi:hypothetical protein